CPHLSTECAAFQSKVLASSYLSLWSIWWRSASHPNTWRLRMMDHINSYRRKKLNGKSPYEAFCFYYGKDLADKLGCHEVAANSINLTPGLLKK
ncbi:MAG: hypothetical protein LBQ71_11595, partial [Hungatella sp.]|nr:hypothetical protein [Hungatella sp.]